MDCSEQTLTPQQAISIFEEISGRRVNAVQRILEDRSFSETMFVPGNPEMTLYLEYFNGTFILFLQAFLRDGSEILFYPSETKIFLTSVSCFLSDVRQSIGNSIFFTLNRGTEANLRRSPLFWDVRQITNTGRQNVFIAHFNDNLIWRIRRTHRLSQCLERLFQNNPLVTFVS